MPASPSPSLDDPEPWLRSTPLLDLAEAKVSLKARALTQLLTGEREKALALYAFAKRIPYAQPYKLGARTPREVLHAGRGDALDKLGVLVAMLRVVGIPARIRLMHLGVEMLAGLPIATSKDRTLRGLLEAFVGGRWQLTDTYIYDAGYVAAARARLRASGASHGYGLHVDGHTLWDGVHDAFLLPAEYVRSRLVPAGEALFRDPAELLRSRFLPEVHPLFTHHVRWNATSLRINKVIREMRAESPRQDLPGLRETDR